MSQPFLGEIKVVSFTFAPKGWAFCNGQLLPLNQNQALFSILGTTYGGDGRVNFGLPNLQGRMPVHVSAGITLGEVGGEANHTLTISELPSHTHVANAQSAPSSPGATPTSAVWASSNAAMFAPSSDSLMSAAAIGTAGSGQPHQNLAPYQVLNFIIALQGIFPSRT